MDRQTDALKEEMMEKFRKGLDEITSKPLGNLGQMEEAVGKLKTELGRETLERLIALKKTQNKKG
jgi:hypothetical protein